MQTVRLSLTELYFLAVQMKAQYYDYGYFAAMPEIQKQYQVRKLEAMASLEEKGFVDVDFTGEVEIDEELRAFLKPVFFGGIETRLIIDGTYTFHILGETVLMATRQQQELTFTKASDEMLSELLSGEEAIIQSASITAGYSEKRYTAEELSCEKTMEEAIHFLKGEGQ